MAQSEYKITLDVDEAAFNEELSKLVALKGVQVYDDKDLLFETLRKHIFIRGQDALDADVIDN
jgi:hypothetical protein